MLGVRLAPEVADELGRQWAERVAEGVYRRRERVEKFSKVVVIVEGKESLVRVRTARSVVAQLVEPAQHSLSVAPVHVADLDANDHRVVSRAFGARAEASHVKEATLGLQSAGNLRYALGHRAPAQESVAKLLHGWHFFVAEALARVVWHRLL